MNITSSATVDSSPIVGLIIDTANPETPELMSEENNSNSILCPEANMEEKEECTKNIEAIVQIAQPKTSSRVLPRKHEKIYDCKACPAAFSRKTQLKCHLKFHQHHENEDLFCNECSVGFSDTKKLLKHKRSKHSQNGKLLKCTECEAEFYQSNSFKLHMRLHNGERPFVCNECDASFVQSSHLSIHKRSHTGEKPYQCSVCKQAFKQISHLRTHERIHTQTKPFSCELCGHSFIQKSSLNRHVRIHTGEKPYVCDVCNASFCVKNNLNRHKSIHTGKQPFDCKLCGATFVQSVDLKRHVISHSGIKPFRCDLCSASFSRSSNLKWHKYAHTGETPFKCDECPSRFTKPRDLKKHKLKHMPATLQRCTICLVEFTQSAALKKHMKLHNSDNSAALEDSLDDSKSLSRKKSNTKSFECKDCNLQFRDQKEFKRHSKISHNIKGEDIDTTSALPNQIQVESNSVTVMQNAICESSILQQPVMTYQMQVQQSALPCSLYNAPDPQSPLPYSASAVGLSSIQQVVQNQAPTLMISSGVGQQMRTGRLNNCQNHFAHVFTVSPNNQLQTWCFCEVPNPNITTTNVNIAAVDSVPVPLQPEINFEQCFVDQQQCQQQQTDQVQLQLDNSSEKQVQSDKVTVSVDGNFLACDMPHIKVEQALTQQQFVLRNVAGVQTENAKLSSSQVNYLTEGETQSQALAPQPVWVNGPWLSQEL